MHTTCTQHRQKCTGLSTDSPRTNLGRTLPDLHHDRTSPQDACSLGCDHGKVVWPRGESVKMRLCVKCSVGRPNSNSRSPPWQPSHAPSLGRTLPLPSPFVALTIWRSGMSSDDMNPVFLLDHVEVPFSCPHIHDREDDDGDDGVLVTMVIVMMLF